MIPRNISEAIGIGERIQEIRENKGYSQKRLADKTRIGLRTIQKYENNEVNPKVLTLCLIADALDCDMQDFLFEKKKETSISIQRDMFVENCKHKKEMKQLFDLFQRIKKSVDSIENKRLRIELLNRLQDLYSSFYCYKNDLENVLEVLANNPEFITTFFIEDYSSLITNEQIYYVVRKLIDLINRIVLKEED